VVLSDDTAVDDVAGSQSSATCGKMAEIGTGGLLAVIKYIYLPSTYIHFMQDIKNKCLLLMSSTSFIYLSFQEHQMMKKHHIEKKFMHIFIMSKTRGSLR
jgi:hypothetical protein